VVGHQIGGGGGGGSTGGGGGGGGGSPAQVEVRQKSSVEP